MHIDKLEITNFRNYDNASLELDRGLNVVYGKNASGKTNLVESIYYAALGKSPRTSKEKDMIRWDSDALNIKINLVKRFRSYNIALRHDGKEKKFLLDRIPITRTSDIIGLINVVYFSPDELSVVKDAPSERRRYIDMSLSQQKKSYFTDLINYNKVLDSRNKLLKSKISTSEFKDVALIYNIQLAKYGARIINNRYLFVEKLKPISERIHDKITSHGEKLSIDYESKIERASVTEMQNAMQRILDENLDKDRQLQYTSIGAHRDDLKLSVNGVDVRKFGSQGQQRTVALTLKMSEVELLSEENGERPILILDDVLSELDECRQTQLLEFTKDTQTILTCTEFNGKADKLIHIDNGKIIDLNS